MFKRHDVGTCFCQDQSDFEWSFWTGWAKKTLLWTLIGHGIISRLTSVFYPKVGRSYCRVKKIYVVRDAVISNLFLTFHQQFRVPALTIYGLLAASSGLGIKGVSVVLVHLGLSFSVAKLKKPTLSWACNLMLLSTFYIQPLQEIQVGCITWIIVPDFRGVSLFCIKTYTYVK